MGHHIERGMTEAVFKEYLQADVSPGANSTGALRHSSQTRPAETMPCRLSKTEGMCVGAKAKGDVQDLASYSH